MCLCAYNLHKINSEHFTMDGEATDLMAVDSVGGGIEILWCVCVTTGNLLILHWMSLQWRAHENHEFDSLAYICVYVSVNIYT